jgi:hypothetical protein
MWKLCLDLIVHQIFTTWRRAFLIGREWFQKGMKPLKLTILQCHVLMKCFFLAAFHRIFRKHWSEMLIHVFIRETDRLDINIFRHYSSPNKEHGAAFSFKILFLVQL